MSEVFHLEMLRHPCCLLVASLLVLVRWFICWSRYWRNLMVVAELKEICFLLVDLMFISSSLSIQHTDTYRLQSSPIGMAWLMAPCSGCQILGEGRLTGERPLSPPGVMLAVWRWCKNPKGPGNSIVLKGVLFDPHGPKGLFGLEDSLLNRWGG